MGLSSLITLLKRSRYELLRTFSKCNMSATTLFRQLTAGITFNTKKFKAESVKFGLVKEEKQEEETKIKVDLPNGKEVAAEGKEKLEKEEIKRKALDGEDSDDITVIGNIKSTNK